MKLTISSESENVSESNSDNELSCECGASGVAHKIHCPRNSRQRYRRFSPSVSTRKRRATKKVDTKATKGRKASKLNFIAGEYVLCIAPQYQIFIYHVGL